MKNIYVPFDGFYGCHDENIDSYFGDEACVVDYKKTFVNYSKKYVEILSNEIEIDLDFVELESPRFYNYGTDKILAAISEENISKMFEEVDKNSLAENIKDNFTSHDGFISFYSNELKNWGSVLTWDEIQLGTLLEVFIFDFFPLSDMYYLMFEELDSIIEYAESA